MGLIFFIINLYIAGLILNLAFEEWGYPPAEYTWAYWGFGAVIVIIWWGQALRGR